MPSARAKSGPSGITITKSRMLMNCTAPTRKTIQPLGGRAADAGITPDMVIDRKRRTSPRSTSACFWSRPMASSS